MIRWESTLILLAALIGSMILACGVQTSEDAQEPDLVIPECKFINESETHQMSFNILSNVTEVSFLMDYTYKTSDLEMVIIAPSGDIIDSTVGEPVIYEKENISLYYIIPEPELGEWKAEITAKDVPEGGEEYCAYMVLGDMAVDTSDIPLNLSDEDQGPEECESCKSG